jgi:hypothetical protein
MWRTGQGDGWQLLGQEGIDVLDMLMVIAAREQGWAGYVCTPPPPPCQIACRSSVCARNRNRKMELMMTKGALLMGVNPCSACVSFMQGCAHLDVLMVTVARE